MHLRLILVAARVLLKELKLHNVKVPFLMKRLNFQLSIIGGSSLNLVGKFAQMVAHKAVGDNSGRLTIRQAQVYFSTESRVLQEYSILAQRRSGVALPQVVNCRGIDVLIKGTGSDCVMLLYV